MYSDQYCSADQTDDKVADQTFSSLFESSNSRTVTQCVGRRWFSFITDLMLLVGLCRAETSSNVAREDFCSL